MVEILKKFNVFEVPLAGTNLIEASAGTGKTHSVVLLALRMILELQMAIDQILMVTFTVDAAAEMKVRLRSLLRDAERVLRHGAEDVDEGVVMVVNQALSRSDHKGEVPLRLVHTALLDFDKAAVYTIHGFCARMLAEYAFESNQVFRAKTVEPDAWKLLVDDAFRNAWRQHITTLPDDVLKFMFENDFSMERVHELVQGGLNGQQILVQGGEFPDVLSISCWIDWLRKKLLTIPASGEGTYLARVMGMSVNILAYFLHKQIAGELNQRKQQDSILTFDDMIKGMRDVICAEKGSNDPKLTGLLRDRFSAVFIDEFQDTDPWQFDILSNVFGDSKTGHIVFYIGDPKQSIYGFRRADLNNYFTASRSVENKWFMPNNYRSTMRYIAAMNEYFQPAGAQVEFDLFHHPKMKYFEVQAPSPPKREGGLHYNGKEVDPMRILWCENASDLVKRTVALLAELLRRPASDAEGYLWYGTYGNQRVEAGQIGVLVRTNKEGRKLKKRLARMSIPAVVVGDERILESAEALDIYYVLTGVWRMTPGDIRRALLTAPGNHFWQDLDLLKFDELFDEFRNYQAVWKEQGVYACLHQFVARGGLISSFLKGALAHSERSVANVFQLMEVLHEVEIEKKLSPEELLFWLKRGMEGERSEGNEHLQRIESDDSAVKIVTIHSCKGLEYDLVIAPYLDLTSTDKYKTGRFRFPDPEADLSAAENADFGKVAAAVNVALGADTLAAEPYKFGETGASVPLRSGDDYISEKKAYQGLKFCGLNAELLVRMQKREENMRLLYVAITRARFQTFVLTYSKPEKKSDAKGASKNQAAQTSSASAQGYLLDAYSESGKAGNFRYVSFGAKKVRDVHSVVENEVDEDNAGAENGGDNKAGADVCPWHYFKPDAPEFQFSYRAESPAGPVTADDAKYAESGLQCAPEAPQINLPDLNWRKLSYSGLSKKAEALWRLKREESPASDEYDRFIFHHLKSGTQTGIMLHELFERIDFQSSEYWQRQILHALKRYPASVRTPDRDGHLRLQEMLTILTSTPLDVNGLALESVARSRRLNEASFYLPLRKIDCGGLLRWAAQRSIGLNIPESGSLEGLLNGVVDLFFEHEGRYYILDWKSDRLGESVGDYDLPLLEQAMAERNYTLQYYLYTLALYRYLKHRIPGFDYEQHFGGVFYVFLRGIRPGSGRGIYHKKPPVNDVIELETLMLAYARMDLFS
jgi:ATP-dependent exoDNAse (exonuclease V) beta subunit